MTELYDFDPNEADYADLRAQDQFEKRQQRALMAHPDCRDPDHPGCDHCEESDDDTDD